MDQQFCYLRFGSWSFDEKSLILIIKNHTLIENFYSQNGEWKLSGRCFA